MISILDFVVAAAYLLLSVGVGLWMGRNNRNLDDYLLGGRSIPWWALLGSIVATETSSATFLSIPGQSFAPGGDCRFLQLAFGFLIGRFLVVLLLLPAYFRGELLTAYELLQTRFGRSTRRIASALFLVTRNLGDGLRMFLTAIALKTAMDLPMTTCILVTGIVTIGYTLFGGLRSVVWSDCAQFVIYFVAALVSLWVLIDRLPGGLTELIDFGSQHEKWRVLRFPWDYSSAARFWADPFSIGAGLIGGAFLTLGTHGADQMMVQRCLAARSLGDASKAMIASGFVVFLQFALFLFIGVAIACFFDRHAPPEPLKPDFAYATFIVQQLPAGLKGLTLAGLFAAAFTSSLNACASTLIGDFGDWFGVDRLTPRQRVTLSRVMTLLFGILQTLIALAAVRFQVGDSVVNEVLRVAGFTGGILLGVFLLGRWPRHVNQQGALVGMVTALVVLLFVEFNRRLPAAVWPESLRFEIAFPWYPVIGSLLTVGVGLIVSRISSRLSAVSLASEST